MPTKDTNLETLSVVVKIKLIPIWIQIVSNPNPNANNRYQVATIWKPNWLVVKNSTFGFKLVAMLQTQTLMLIIDTNLETRLVV